MNSLPALEGQVRVLIIEDDMVVATRILKRCTEAGMDSRYAPHGQPAVEAIKTAHPHIVVMGVSEPEDLSLRLGAGMRRVSAVPVLVMTEARTNVARWLDFIPDASQYIAKDSPAQAILEHIAAHLKRAYQAEHLMISESAEASVKGIPHGWGKCQTCGYLGPRMKFVNPDPLARHSLQCPACKHFEDIVFELA